MDPDPHPDTPPDEEGMGPGQAVEALVSLGLDEDVARRAVVRDQVALALVQDLIDEPRPLTFAEVVERTRVPPDVLRERYRTLGVAEHLTYGASEVREAELLRQLLDVVPEEALVRVLRVDGQALHRVVLAHLDLVYDEIVAPIRDAGGNDIAVALALAESHRSLRPVAAELLSRSYQRILEQLLLSELVAEATRAGGEDLELAVGFADVVGYTSLSARIDPRGLEEVIEAFEARCYGVAGVVDDVQLVKLLGDAAMFVATDAATLAAVLLEVVAPAEEDSPLAGSPIRAGMALGPVILRGGDYYGTTVNLAARLTDRARAGRLLVAAELAEHLPGFELKRTPSMTLRGLGRHRPLAVRRPVG